MKFDQNTITKGRSTSMRPNILHTLSKEKLTTHNTLEKRKNVSKKGFKIDKKNFNAIIKFDQPLLVVGHSDLNANYEDMAEFRSTTNNTTIDEIKHNNRLKSMDL